MVYTCFCTDIIHEGHLKIIEEAKKYGDVIVFAPKDPGKDYDDSKFQYKVVRCKSLKFPIIDYGLPIPRFDRNFNKELEKYKLDIVHIHSPFMVGNMGIKYAKKHEIPVIGTMHSQFKQDLKRAVKSEKIAKILNNTLIRKFNKCDECWAVNSEVARIFYEDYGYREMPRVMNNATEMEEIKDIKKAHEDINKIHDIKEDEKVFLFVGRINNLKNVFFLANSLKILKDKNKDLKFKMLFVGNGQDEEGLKELIKNNNMENEIIMCGKVTDKDLLAKYYSRADLFLFPSMYDASSIVQIEAASQKTPTLFLEGAATAATVTGNVNGFLSENDEEKYANHIIEIMSNNELYESVCKNVYNDLYKNWDKAIDEVYERYKEITEKKEKEKSNER